MARIISARQLKKETLEGRSLGPARHPALGMVVWKSSRSTGLTYGFVDGVRMQVNLEYPEAGLRRLQQVFRIIPRPDSGDLEVSAPGDSGAIWVEAASGQAVGLHFAGEIGDQPEFALAHDLTYVLAALGIRLAGAPAAPPPSPPAPPGTPPPTEHSLFSQLLALLRQILSR